MIFLKALVLTHMAYRLFRCANGIRHVFLGTFEQYLDQRLEKLREAAQLMPNPYKDITFMSATTWVFAMDLLALMFVSGVYR